MAKCKLKSPHAVNILREDIYLSIYVNGKKSYSRASTEHHAMEAY